MSFIILPNVNKLWTNGISLSLYSKSWDPINREQDFTELGKLVSEFKYSRSLSPQRGLDITRVFAEEVAKVLKLTAEKDSHLFNSLIAIPPNRANANSLPKAVAHELSEKFTWLINDSKYLVKNHEIAVIKNLPVEERAEMLRGAYSTDSEYDLRHFTGFLVLDDIYQSGATLKEVCRTLKRAHPEVPRYVLTMTHLRSTWDQSR
jgi:predicted amidophosphoribosyltransferase